MKHMKTIKNITIYKCKYCGKIYVKKIFAEKHHFKCRKNPENIGICHSCTSITKKSFKVFFSSTGGDWEEDRTSFYCIKKNIYIKPRWASDLDEYFADELPEIINMPLKCDYYPQEAFFK